MGTANIYAGNLCRGAMNNTDTNPYDTPNQFNGAAVVQIDGYARKGSLGDIYACGAQVKNSGGTSGKGTYFDPQKYTVTTAFHVALRKEITVYGKGALETNVTYIDAGNGYPNSIELFDVASLTVESGSLSITSGDNTKNLTVNSGAILNLSESVITSITNFTGGGSLVLGESKPLHITGTVSGETAVGIGGIFNNASTEQAKENFTYIQAPNSFDTSFRLLPHSSQPTMKFVRNESGAWSASTNSGDSDVTLVKSFRFDTDDTPNPTTTAGQEIVLPLEVIPEGTNPFFYLDDIPLTVDVNNTSLNPVHNTSGENPYYTYSYSLGELSMLIEANDLYITPDSTAKGTYTIRISIPGKYTTTGQPLNDTISLVVNKVDLDPTLKTATIPTAVRNLKWTGSQQTGVPTGEGYTLTNHTATAVGSYDATATLSSGYQWSDGTTDPKTITWSIARADGPAAPTGLTPSAPTGANLADGKISGTTTDMEYSSSSDFSNPISCTGTEITSLAAGTYYVRLKATDTHEAGSAATVTVPAYQAPTDPGTKPDPDDKPTNPGDPGNNPDKPNNNKPGTSTGGNTSTSRPVTKPDGTTVTTTTDKTTGTVTVTTKRPDGSQRVEETRKDGTVVTTEKSANGSTTQTISFTDGSSDTNINQAGGLTASLSVDANGKATGEVRLPAQLSGGGQSVSLPIPAVQVAYNGQNASSLTLYTGRSYPVTVAIPTQTTSPGTVAVLVKGNGQEEVVKTCVIQNGSLVVDVPDGACVKILDNGKSFADTNQHWARDAIAFTSARDLFSGTSATNFTPDGPMGRDMLMTVLARFDGVDTSGGSTWSEKGMAWAVANGISDGSDPTGRISREQLVTMLYRYAGSPSVNSSQSLPFQDAGAVSGYAQNAVRWAVSQGILNGYNDGSLNPGGDTTRAQAATIFMQYAQYLAR